MAKSLKYSGSIALVILTIVTIYSCGNKETQTTLSTTNNLASTQSSTSKDTTTINNIRNNIDKINQEIPALKTSNGTAFLESVNKLTTDVSNLSKSKSNSDDIKKISDEVKAFSQLLDTIKYPLEDSSEDLGKIQEYLKKQGLLKDLSNNEIPGLYGDDTVEALKKYFNNVATKANSVSNQENSSNTNINLELSSKINTNASQIQSLNKLVIANLILAGSALIIASLTLGLCIFYARNYKKRSNSVNPNSTERKYVNSTLTQNFIQPQQSNNKFKQNNEKPLSDQYTSHERRIVELEQIVQDLGKEVQRQVPYKDHSFDNHDLLDSKESSYLKHNDYYQRNIKSIREPYEDLVEIYNRDPGIIMNHDQYTVTKVSESGDSVNNRYSDSSHTKVNLTIASNNNYLVIETDQGRDEWLVPKAGFKLGTMNRFTFTELFKYPEDISSYRKLVLIRPAKVVKTSTGWQLTDKGEVRFES